MISRTLLICPLVWLAFPWHVQGAEAIDYSRDIKPLLTKHCVSCHGVEKQRSGLRLDYGAAILKGGNSGPAAIPGRPGDSLILKALLGHEGTAIMPPKEPRLSSTEIARVRGWIEEGAKFPSGEVIAAATRKSHWAFVPPVAPPEPMVRNSAWPRNAIDHFLLATLEAKRLHPSPEADRETLVRRVTLDLTGLPPTPDEVERFVQDPSPEAYSDLVDRLLASPHYGERWGRWWLDQARYADSNGYSIDAARSIWPYRDWVINALNRDMPFNQFTIEQLAGDLLPGATVSQKVATGFHRNTQINQEGGIDVEMFRVESVIDRVNTTGTVWLGLTVGCCQCHDHKFDPLTQREYYQLFAFLNNADEPTLELGDPAEVARRQQVRGRITQVQKRLKPLDPTTTAGFDRWEKALTTPIRQVLPADVQALLELPENGRTPSQKSRLEEAYRLSDMARQFVPMVSSCSLLSATTNAHLGTTRLILDRQLTQLRREEPQIPTTMVLQERPTPRATPILLGGEFTRRGALVTPGVPAVLPPLKSSERPTRLDLARWLVDGRNPLTARVLVNRIWQVYFGLGLVETENDFGTQGTAPSHPELLDWLATQVVAEGWSLKAIHRLIVTSAAYRQSSRIRPDLQAVDPRNRLLARQSRLRLEAEGVRDVGLAASGLLSRKVGGPSVFPPQPDGVYRLTQIDKNWKADVGPERFRRGLYTYFWRSAPHPSLTVFDAPDASCTCTRRNRSNTPLQALTLLNEQGQFELARALATRILKEAESESQRVRFAFRVCLARHPTEREVKLVNDLLVRQRQETQEAGPVPGDLAPGEFAAWVATARVLLNLDEFITRE